MNAPLIYPPRDYTPVARRLGGVSLHRIASIMLASWLFSLAVCTVSVIELGESPAQHPGASLHLDGHAQHHSDGTHKEDACCAVLQNLSTFSHASNVQAMLHNLTYALLPAIIFIYATLFLPISTRFFWADPPGGKSNHVLIANSLWPHAPPR